MSLKSHFGLVRNFLRVGIKSTMLVSVCTLTFLGVIDESRAQPIGIVSGDLSDRCAGFLDPAVVSELSASAARERAFRLREIGMQLSDHGAHDCAAELLRLSAEFSGPSDLITVSTQRELARVYELAGMYRDARDTWFDLLRRFSGDSFIERNARAGILIKLGDLYVKWGKFADAEDAYLNALQLVPGHSGPSLTEEMALRGLIRFYTSRSEYASAEEAAARLVRVVKIWVDLDPQNIDLLVAALMEHRRLLELVGDTEGVREADAQIERLRTQ